MHPSATEVVFAALVLGLLASAGVALWVLRCLVVRIADGVRLGVLASVRWRVGNARLASRNPVSDRLVAPLVDAMAQGKVHVASVTTRGWVHRRLHVRFDDGRTLELRAFVAAEADRFAHLWHRGDILGVRIRFLPSAGWVLTSAAGRREATCFSYAATVVA